MNLIKGAYDNIRVCGRLTTSKWDKLCIGYLAKKDRSAKRESKLGETNAGCESSKQWTGTPGNAGTKLKNIEAQIESMMPKLNKKNIHEIRLSFDYDGIV